MNTFKKILAFVVIAAMSSTAFAVVNPSYEDVKAAKESLTDAANRYKEIQKLYASAH